MTGVAVKVVFVDRDGKRRTLMGVEGETLLQLAQRHGFDIEGACGGAMACSTCHLIVDPTYAKLLPSPGDEELAMLDLTPALTPTSRLGCQIVLKTFMDGLTVKIPD